MMLLTPALLRARLRQMGRRETTGILTVLWALAVLPALCTAGVICHACDCGESSECRHECDCSTDPCKQLTIARSERYDHLVTPVVPDHVACPLSFMNNPRPVYLELREISAARLFHENLPYPPSDVPLLI